MIMVLIKGLLLLFFCFCVLQHCSCATYPQDVAALKALSANWKNTPPSWGNSEDPCGGDNWEGVSCNDSRVTNLKLFNMGIEGTLSGDIGSLTGLTSLDLSYNRKLGGSIPQSIGNLKSLTMLRLISCNLIGVIPNQIGSLLNLTILALNSNQLTGAIPASLGQLSNLVWLDLADNQLNGNLPISGKGTSGLDQLIKTEHFHLNKNQLAGPIPQALFNSSMKMIHLLLDSNKLVGEIPDSIGVVQTLRIIRLDNNSLNGSVPATISNLPRLYVLHLANNMLTGPMPNLTGMTGLNYLDLSNNSFEPSRIPSWLLDFRNLTSLIIENASLQGEMEETIFSFPKMQEVRLANNEINGTLSMKDIIISSRLKIMDLRNNSITNFLPPTNYNNTLILLGNPVCEQNNPIYTTYCKLQQENSTNDVLKDISCSKPYQVQMVFRAPYFHDITPYVKDLENRISANLNQTRVEHAITNIFFNGNSYLEVHLKICPLKEKHFTRVQILEWLDLSTQSLQAPETFGPYYPDPSSYEFARKVSLSTGVIVGIAISCIVMVFAIVALGVYALRKKNEAKQTIALTNPFASWGTNGEDTGDAPKIKAARFFPYDEIRKCTADFSNLNEIGSGGYGKVYRGILPDGEIVAVKRSQKGSSQGGLEFKTEIELLSRVHHKNLVQLLGFCFEKGEKIIVYEYISNGTLWDNLSGKTNMHLDWKRRLRIALDSARGLAYLHEFANPPIIHRDVKSTNILLDKNLTAKVADFGLSKIAVNSDGATTVKGTLGYLDPEYYMTQQLTTMSDVYSFGVVMLELITATLPIHQGRYIVQEVKMAYIRNDKQFCGLKNVMDPSLLKEGVLLGFDKYVELAIRCVHNTAENHRPAMNDIVKEIETIMESYKFSTSASSATYEADIPTRRHNEILFTSGSQDSQSSYDSERYLLSDTIHHTS